MGINLPYNTHEIKTNNNLKIKNIFFIIIINLLNKKSKNKINNFLMKINKAQPSGLKRIRDLIYANKSYDKIHLHNKKYKIVYIQTPGYTDLSIIKYNFLFPNKEIKVYFFHTIERNSEILLDGIILLLKSGLIDDLEIELEKMILSQN